MVWKCHCFFFALHVFPQEDKWCPLTETSSMAFSPPVICQSPQIPQHREDENAAPFGYYHAEKPGVNRRMEKNHVADILSEPLMNKFSTVKTTWVSAHASLSNGRRKNNM